MFLTARRTSGRNDEKMNSVTDNPMNAPQNYDVRESKRVLEFQNSDFLIRPIDLSWHFPIFVTIREMRFKTYRGRSSEKSKAGENKIEESNKQKTLKNRDEEWNSTRWKYSSWNWTTSSSSSAWQEWSADVTRERTNWQSADWDSSDHACERSESTLLMAMRSSSQILTRASMTTKIMSVCDGVHLFVISATCSACCEKHVRLSWSLILAFHPFHDCLAQGQLVSAHCVISFICVLTKKGSH